MIVLLLSSAFAPVWSQKNSLSPPTAKSSDDAKEKRLQWFRDAHFGMMIHWGLYSVPAGEWKGLASPDIDLSGKRKRVRELINGRDWQWNRWETSDIDD